MKKKTQILLTNDDGIQSPGLWAAAEKLSELGYVTVAAPQEQYSGAGRSLPIHTNGTIRPTHLHIGTQDWTAYAVGGTPAQVVLHAVMRIMPEPPSLVVSGINYGENIGEGITASGTVGAAMEAAALGFPSLAVSLQTSPKDHLSHSLEVDFSAAAYFTRHFSEILLNRAMPQDVRLLKVDVPDDATPDTPWRITRLGFNRYFLPLVDRNISWEDHSSIGYEIEKVDPQITPRDTDVYALLFDHVVAVTPLSLDLTSRVDLSDLEKMIRANHD
jgi:5'-nucleotidase